MSFDSWTVALLGKDIYNDGELVSPRVKGLNFVGASLIQVDTQNGWVTVAFTGGGGGGDSPLTTKGDIYVYSSADTRLPLGSNGQLLSVNTATATGLQWINAPSTTDPDAIHDNVSGEISAVTLKASPTGSDLVLIEDAAASNAKKRVTLTSIVALASSTDAAAIHDNVAGEILAVTAKTTPASGDVVLLEDSAASNAKKRMTMANLLANALVDDADAIHDNIAGEIAGITAKTTPASGDLVLLEDSAASNAKKRMTLGNLLSNSLVSDATAIHDNVSGEIAAVTLKGTPANSDLILIEDSAASNAKKRVTVQSLVGLAGTTDPNAIHGNASGEIAAIASKTTPASGDLLLIEDSAASNAKKRISVSALLGIAPVQSVFGRVGAVVATVGDYVASQVNNDSTVVGATVAAALNTINTALASLVPTSRTLTAGDGMTGGGNLTANRTFNVVGSASITVGANDVAVNPSGVDHNSLANTSTGDVHTQYMNREANATVNDNRLARWDGTTGRDLQNSNAVLSDSGALSGLASVEALSYYSVGTNPATDGFLRGPTNFTLQCRNAANNANRIALRWVSDVVGLGDAATVTEILGTQLEVSAPTTDFNGNSVVDLGYLRVQGNAPVIDIVDADGGVDGKRWRLDVGAVDDALRLTTRNDAGTVLETVMRFDRTGSDFNGVSFPSSIVTTNRTDEIGTRTANLSSAVTNAFSLNETDVHVRLTSSANNNALAGITGGTQGRRIYVTNVDASDQIIISHEAGTATAENRIQCPSGVNIQVPPFGSVTLFYDGVSSRWRAIR